MYASLFSMGLIGVDAYVIQVEAHINSGMPAFTVVGLPGDSVRESRDRVRSAICNCGFEFPGTHITVGLAPADVHKSGTLYDLPLMLSILAAMGQICPLPQDAVFIGELSLDGRLRHVDGVLPIVAGAAKKGIRQIFIPSDNAAEASVVEGIECYAVDTVEELIAFLEGKGQLEPIKMQSFARTQESTVYPDLSEVKGQEQAKRALEIAAAGGHNLLLIGQPGSGKSMLAKRLPSILPKMSFEEAIETTGIYSVAGLLKNGVQLMTERPFRSPHHSASPAALSGGGAIPMPGEISLAHNGVLFLDEFPEFGTAATEALRQPMEDATVTVARATMRVTYPCAFQLVAAMNPCRCGYFGDPQGRCTCTPQSVTRYLGKVSGPLLDRIDLHVDVMPVDYEKLSDHAPAETSAAVRARVEKAREIQRKRFEGTGITCNARITPARIDSDCMVTESARKLMKLSFDRLSLSARAYSKVLKVARTIADLEGSEYITSAHVAEAVQYRSLDRKYFSRGQNGKKQ